MIPTVFATTFTIFPKDKQAIISPVIGLVATLAPTIGPTVGGYLTDLLSWHWLFLVNVIPGIGVTLAAWFLIDFDEPQWDLLRGLDWLGLASLAVFLGSLEYFLEEGAAKEWFQSELIVWAFFGAVAGGLVLVWRLATQSRPIVDLWAFRDRNFATGCLLSFVLGIGLYGLTYLYPVYLARVRGFSSLQIGETLFLTGVAMFLTAPVAGILSRKLDPRIMIAIGFVGFGVGTWQASSITNDWSFTQLIIPQLLRGVSLMLCMVPITTVALGTLPLNRLKDASGVFNLTRNLGGAVGLAAINTLLGWRTDLHMERLRENISWGRSQVDEAIAGMTQSLAPLGSDAGLGALKQMSRLVRREGLVMGISDVFLALTVMFVALSVLAMLMQKPRAADGGGGGH
jgi:MFS transporter, DHA2 family, multidrug resistance protein